MGVGGVCFRVVQPCTRWPDGVNRCAQVGPCWPDMARHGARVTRGGLCCQIRCCHVRQLTAPAYRCVIREGHHG
jgi:hypothetical protein